MQEQLYTYKIADLVWEKNLDHFSICAGHPCAGAMLIFSVSFQFYRMTPKGQIYILMFRNIYPPNKFSADDEGELAC